MSVSTKHQEKKAAKQAKRRDGMYTASQGKLIALRFFRHKLALIGLILLVIFYTAAIFAPFLSINDPAVCFDSYTYCYPQGLKFWDDNGFSFRPFYYRMTTERNPVTLAKEFVLDTSERVYVDFFGEGYEYKLFGLIPTNIHLIATEEDAPLFLFGTDNLGRDLFSRNMYAGRISLTIGLVGVAITFIIGCALGGIAGYYGGMVDNIICRFIEFLMAIPTMPLWMALSAALPRNWSQLKLYMAITVILSLSNWTGLARVVRGKLISIRGDDYITAAALSGVPDRKIILHHMLPSFSSYLIVNITMSIPGMILGETALSYLGLGLQSPTISWGVLLSEAQSIKVVALNPWVMLPGVFVVIAVLAFNFVGDGLRDAADPYKGD